MYTLRKEYCTRNGRAQEAFQARAKPRGRPVTSDRPPPRRCGQAMWAFAGRPHFSTGEMTHHITGTVWGVAVGRGSVFVEELTALQQTSTEALFGDRG
jgi:hypothetical protein